MVQYGMIFNKTQSFLYQMKQMDTKFQTNFISLKLCTTDSVNRELAAVKTTCQENLDTKAKALEDNQIKLIELEEELSSCNSVKLKMEVKLSEANDLLKSKSSVIVSQNKKLDEFRQDNRKKLKY